MYRFVIVCSYHIGGVGCRYKSTIALSLVQSRLVAIFLTKAELDGETILVSFLTPPIFSMLPHFFGGDLLPLFPPTLPLNNHFKNYLVSNR
jgi:hypothetical protein